MTGGMYATGVGRLTRDPVLRETAQKVSVCEFAIACNYKVGTTEDVLFMECVAWRGAADTIAKYTQKGSALFVRGRLQQQEWEGRDGVKRSRLQLVVDSFSFLDTRQTTPGSDDRRTTPGGAADQSLPF